jgi:hypothetical protein
MAERVGATPIRLFLRGACLVDNFIDKLEGTSLAILLWCAGLLEMIAALPVSRWTGEMARRPLGNTSTAVRLTLDSGSLHQAFGVQTDQC